MDLTTTLNLRRNIQKNKANEKLAAVARDYFYNQDHGAIKYYLGSDLVNTYSLEDIPDLKHITVDFFVSRFLQMLVNVYNNPPVFKFEDSVNPIDKERFTDLMNEVEVTKMMQDNGYKCRLHNTILVQVRHNRALDRIFIENDYNLGNCEVITYDGFNYEPEIIGYEFPYKGGFVWVVWDKGRKEHYLSKSFKFDESSRQFIGDKIPIEGNEGIDMPNYWPWVVYRYKKQNAEFWGNGIDGIVELNRVINVLLTICSDDIINETLAVWLYNFNPAEAGNKRNDGKIKTGFRNPFTVESKIGGTSNPSVQVARADLFVNDILSFIESLAMFVSNMHGIDNILKTKLNEELAGVSIRMKNEPLLRQWAEDVQIFRPMDKKLIEALVALNNEVRPKNKINPKILEKLNIDYQEPRMLSDTKEELEIELEKIKNGVGSLTEYVMRRNPEMNKKEAAQYIKDNLQEYEELFGKKFAVTLGNDNGDQDANKQAGDAFGKDSGENQGDNGRGDQEWAARQRSDEKENNGTAEN